MANAFRTHIKASLADENLQTALDANAERRVKVRQVAFESLDNPAELREKAHRIRHDVVEHLDSYLEQFISRAGENGIIVHRAENADQAIKTVLEIAEQHGAKLIAKSKTMVSEEIGLNHTLEKHGLEVIETDLGEYIVQLRGEPPSHIITPAVHLRRQDVGKLFEEKLGLAYTEDISVMTNTARQILRQVFLDADIGISGVNFGVAETGTLCVVTNEGNGRMVITLPRIHVALMGIERIVPTMEDLALMLSLLPRSATGQKLSVYTSLLNRPRAENDPDGPRERHVILVDNGRMAVRESDLQEIL
jgi:L-lactate dehydrogenase complex protein LldF